MIEYNILFISAPLFPCCSEFERGPIRNFDIGGMVYIPLNTDPLHPGIRIKEKYWETLAVSV